MHYKTVVFRAINTSLIYCRFLSLAGGHRWRILLPLLPFLVLLGCGTASKQARLESLAISTELQNLKSLPITDSVIHEMEVLQERSAKIQADSLSIELQYEIATAKFRRGHNKDALAILEPALEACQGLRPAAPFLESKLRSRLGVVFGMLGYHEKEQIQLREAIRIRTDLLGGEHPEMVSLYLNMGGAFIRVKDYPKAQDMFSKGIRIRGQERGEHHRTMVGLYNNMAIALTELGRYPEARDMTDRIAVIFEQKTGTVDGRANYLNTLANIYDLEGDYGRALQLFKECLSTRQQDPQGARIYIAGTYYNLARIYKKLGDYQLALDALDESMQIIAAETSVEHLDYLDAKIVAAGCLNKLSRYEEAEHSLLDVIAVLAEPSNNEAVHTLANAYGTMGSLLLDMDRFAEATSYYQKGLEIYLELYGETHYWTAEALYQLGYCDYRQQRLASAQSWFIRCLSSLEYNLEAPDLEACANLQLVQEPLILLADIHAEQGDREKVYQYCRQYQKINDWLRANLAENVGKNKLVGHELQVAEVVLKSSFNDNQELWPDAAAMAIATMQRTKAAHLFEAMRESQALRELLPPGLRAEELDLRTTVNYYRSQIIEQRRSDPALLQEASLQLNQQYLDSKQEYEAFQRRIEVEYPRYHDIRYKPKTIAIHSIQQDVLASNQGVLEFFLTKEYLYTSLIRPDTILLRQIPITFSVQGAIQRFIEGLSGYYTAEDPTDAYLETCVYAYLEEGVALYELLIAPVEDWLPNELIIIPDGPLQDLPFSVLLKEQPKDINNFATYPYFFEGKLITYAYSCASWVSMSAAQETAQDRRGAVAIAPFTRFGLGHLPPSEQRGMRSILSDEKAAALPYSEQELRSLQQFFAVHVIRDTQATRTAFLDLNNQYSIVHLATHASVDSSNHQFSYLLFYHPTASSDSVRLYFKDIYASRLQADLLVLSACQTGNGTAVRGEGVNSLGRAFAYNSARTIVNSLWEIDDQYTADIMHLFYERLHAGAPKGQALWEAKQAYLKELKNGQSAHPFFWAGITLTGHSGQLEH